LLELLGDRFATMKYDVKAFLRELALSKTYQRSLAIPSSLPELAAKLEPQLEQWKAQTTALAEAVSQAEEKALKLSEQIGVADAAADPIYDELTKANTAIGEARKKSDAAAKALTDAKNQLAAKQAIATPLGEASTSASKAVELLPGEKELLALAQKLKARADKIAAEVAAADKAVVAKTPAAKTTAEALAAAKAATEEVKKRFDAARAKVRELQALLAPANSEHQVATTQKTAIAAQIATAELAIGYTKLSATQSAAEAELQKRSAELAEARKAMQAIEPVLAKMKTDLVAAQQAAESMTAAHAAMAKQYATRQEIATLTAQATAGATIAASKLPDDTELKTTLTSLAKRDLQLKTEVAELQKLVAQKEEEAKVAVQRMNIAQTTTAAKAKEVAALQATVAPLEKTHSELNAKAVAGRTELNQLTSSLVSRWEAHFFANRLDHLSPEEMAWSMMQATDFLQGQIAAGKADADKTLAIDPKNPADPARLAEREKHVEAFVYEKVKGHLATFVKLFGHAAGQPQADFFATVDQALFFSNGGTVLSWLNPSGNNLTARLNKLEDPQAIAEEMYISVLTRRPDDQEAKEIVEYLASRKDDKVGALKEMAWALVTSAEFRFSH
jgi:chromosome segregation ATPase